jgi:hypothetical protein
LRKIATILLLGVLLFNWFGYRLLVNLVQDTSDRAMQSRLDDNTYDESQLISIKAPITHLSYYTNSEAFVRVNGSIEIEGVQYKYVKRRIYNDSLEVLCLPDRAAAGIQAFKKDFFRLVNGFQTGSDKHTGGHSLPHKNPVEDPFVFTTGFTGHLSVFKLLPTTYFHPAFFPSILLFTAERPPAFLS